ncbi:O-antigen ligase family protein [Plebeiibacterium sediminum]|uniref:O-antigen ligase domain-containing protein n=1 Tax=Plebeiibacterium sediminum TaxID=2992112 RepID=A0AAE3M3V4_9BACT|nr:hypothetical protein [Plebeiobacterium sediminum]MCW3786761.1 hypothetical protein [Plebeiobacterium sediminum]
MMLKKETLIIFFLVSLGVFRVDFSGEFLPFELTPSVALSVVVNIYVLVFAIKNTTIKINQELSLILSIYLVYILLRCFSLPDTSLIKRIILFFYTIISCYSFTILLKDQWSKINNIYYKFSKWSVIVYAFFSLIQIYLFLKGGFYQDNSNSFVKLYPQTISYFLPRLTGGFIDPNVCGFFFSFLYLLSFKIEKRDMKWYRRLYGLIILITLSRSAIAAHLGIVGVRLLFIKLIQFKNIQFYINKRRAVFSLIIFGGLIYIVRNILGHVDLSLIIKGLQTRLLDVGSTGHHFLLLQAGKEIIMESWHSVILGHGFMSGSFFASSFFGGDKYANFHSEYITYLIEIGLVGLCLHVIIIIFPLFRILRTSINNNILTMLLFCLAIALQGIFYQQYMFFYYWVFIFMNYLTYDEKVAVNE